MIHTFSPKSLEELSTCHKDLQTLFNEVIKEADCRILEGHRGEEAQERAVREGNSKLHYPNGKHNATPSNAVDVIPCINGKPVEWKDHDSLYFFAGRVLGTASRLLDEGKMSYQIRWGGDWDGDNDLKDQTFMDLVHFELKPVK